MSAAPKTIRWRDAVMDDPALSWQAKASAHPLARHADLDGSNCYPGAETCARESSLSVSTIKRGWAELKSAGYLDVLPLPAGRRRTHGATKVFRFPARHGVPQTPSQKPDMVSHRHGVCEEAELVSHRHPTYPGNHEDQGPGVEGRGVEGLEIGPPSPDEAPAPKPRAKPEPSCIECGGPLGYDDPDGLGAMCWDCVARASWPDSKTARA